MRNDSPQSRQLSKVAPDNSDASSRFVLIIQAGGHSLATDLAELWTHRELLYFLVWRDIKIRYKQTMFGAAWAILQPLLTTVIFTLLFGRLAHVPSDGVPYPVFAYAGLLPWTFFSNAVAASSNSLVGNSHLITKVYFPRMVIPGGAVGAALLDFAIAFIVLFGMFVYYHLPITPADLLLVPLALLIALLAFAMGMWTSALNVKYRDIRHALPFLIQIWMFASPIIYPVTFVPARWRSVLVLNPLTGIIDGFRAALFERTVDWRALSASVLITTLSLSYAIHYFRRMEREFADVI